MASKAVKWHKILLFGDSLTQRSFSADGCWGSLTADHFQRCADVVVRGFSGYTSRNCLALLPYVASDLKDVVGATVFLGANDASLENSTQAVPLKEYSDNMRAIVRHFQNAGVKTIMITPPALDGESWKRYCESAELLYAKDEELTAKYAEACIAVAEELDVPCVDIHTEMKTKDYWKTFLVDGLHLSKKGSQLLSTLVVPALEKHLSSILPEYQLLPLWNELGPDNSAEAFKEWLEKNG
ncbi:isoamyl acetate-hydrolyzing esterase 1 homolog [Penaeus japonicus]|uniref:isoamyl acetate-hydrolyzing esterase 1 homolog n=1 Tax=Penaeus japonicus TaxID=27405 RepID=UPI001C716E70|nr:isoamyl acetate-hydrolyzing esterase 1 homolog [Penaeus japonicus]